MKKKDKYNRYFMSVAKLTSTMSHCKRRRVGVVIVKDNRIIVNGWNGTLPGTDNVCEDSYGVTKDDLLHAEENAILFAAKSGIELKDSVMYVTTSPCIKCARMIIASGIKKLYYLVDYRCSQGLRLLKENNIKYKKIN